MEQKQKQINILVTGIGGPAGINTARLLRDIPDTKVFGCDMDETASGQLLVDVTLFSPAVRDAAVYQKWITEAVAEHAIDIIIPTVHEELSVLRSFADELPAYVPLSDPDTLVFGDDKVRMYEWAKINLPDNHIRTTTLDAWRPDFSTEPELFIKPRVGRGARGCQKVTASELKILKQVSENPEDIIVMEYMPGKEWTVDAYVDQDGDITYMTPRVRLGLTGGISIKGETVKDEAVLAATKDMLDKLPCRGPVCIQWKADANGVPRLIEINPRLSGGLPISVAAGINPVVAILEEFTGKKPAAQDWREVRVLGYHAYEPLN